MKEGVMMDEGIEELENLCKPIVEFIKKNYDSHTYIEISENSIYLRQDIIGIPKVTTEE